MMMVRGTGKTSFVLNSATNKCKVANTRGGKNGATKSKVLKCSIPKKRALTVIAVIPITKRKNKGEDDDHVYVDSSDHVFPLL